ncbi:protein-tyrosine phosphatase-like protein [Dichotomocladium elegans]|nr:protein-tyrosine phosphatase-like protein [Dichotomocladium elegans]
MRREMQEIVPGLFLGPFSTCRNVDELKAAGITHILCFLDENEYRIFKTDHLAQNFIFKPVQISDTAVQNLIPIFPQCTQFIKNAIEQNGKVLVCCNTGMSRSPSFVIAYTMEMYNMNATQAYQYVQSKRLCINPNDGFKSQLNVREYCAVGKRKLRDGV